MYSFITLCNKLILWYLLNIVTYVYLYAYTVIWCGYLYSKKYISNLFIYTKYIFHYLKERKRKKKIIVINIIEVSDTHVALFNYNDAVLYISYYLFFASYPNKNRVVRIYIKLPPMKFHTYHMSIFTFMRHNRLSIIPLNFLRSYATVILSLRFLQLIFLQLLIPVHMNSVELSLMHDR